MSLVPNVEYEIISKTSSPSDALVACQIKMIKYQSLAAF